MIAFGVAPKSNVINLSYSRDVSRKSESKISSTQRGKVDLELPIHLDRGGGHLLEDQLVAQLNSAIKRGYFAAGSRLPSTRTLATTLKVSRNVVAAAYDKLWVQGTVQRTPGSGTYVAPVSLRGARSGQLNKTANSILRGSVPTEDWAISDLERLSLTALLPSEVWRQFCKGLQRLSPPNVGPLSQGDDQLRCALQDYLRRTRGLECRAEDIIITSGVIQAVDLVIRACVVPGSALGMEEPGDLYVRKVLNIHSSEVHALEIDEVGLRVDLLPQGRDALKLIHVTPSHQFPLGGRLPLERRTRLLEWAAANTAIILEEDHGSEFRYEVPPLAALASMGHDGRVVYLGSFSNVLTPALRIGYLVAPPLLRQAIVRLQEASGSQASWPIQRALAEFIRSGALEKHIRHLRQRLAHRRALLLESLRAAPHFIRVFGSEAGLHVCLEFPEEFPVGLIVKLAQEKGVYLQPLSSYCALPTKRNAAMLSYGSLSDDNAVSGARLVVQLIQDLNDRDHAGS